MSSIKGVLALLLGLSLGLSLACAKTTNALMVVNPETVESVSSQEALRSMSEADVLYLGERHDQLADHQAQLEIIQAMHRKNADVAIALEMFQRPFQGALDQYLAGKIDEAQLIELTEYNQRWGFPWELYAPIFRYAQQHQIPLVALNTPSEVSYKVAKSGLESLEGDDLTHIPDVADIDTRNGAYRDSIVQAFGSHDAHGKFNFDNFFAAQVTWDETMADAIAQFRQSQPQSQVIVLAGQGHVIYGYGIPDRVQRRLGADLKQQIVLLNPLQDTDDEAIADIFWYRSSPTQP
jgi:uncharacterized iron-regulated protein